MVSLLDNKTFQDGNSLLYPDPNLHSNDLVAGPAVSCNKSTHMLLGLFSPEPFDRFSMFGQVSENSVGSNNEDMYAYGRLLEALKGEESGVSWCSGIIHVSGDKL